MNIHVGNIPRETTEQDLRSLFASCGKIESIEIIKNIRTGEPLGYAFVVFQTQEDGESAIEALDGTTFKGKEITVQAAKRPEGKRKSFPRRPPR